MLGKLFGIGPWWSVVADVGKDLMIAGEPFKVKVSHARLLENTTLEVVEPTGPSLWADFIATTGGGVHHICYDVSNWQEMVDTVESLGGKMLVAANVFGKKFCYMRMPTGLVVEFADERIHADAEKLLRSKPLPAVSLDGGHIGTIVKDTKQAKELYKILGYETWWTTDAAVPKEAMIVGDAFSLRVSDTLLAGRTILELLEPLSKGSLWDEFVKTTGGGMHHIGFEVPDWQATIDKMKSVGGKVLVSADVWGGKFAYVQLPFGMIVEFQTIPSHGEAQKMFGIIE
ncbi:MAG: hypothetical protein FJ025_01350 [Chloroflexi bacterium]|nr:hypothetical protein [Chloroflexota bacterium]